MNLNELFSKQQELDNHIIVKHKLHGQDLFEKKTVALLTELYECVNEARFFKFWSENQKPNIKEYGNNTESSEYLKRWRNPLLEEYVDTIHFTLSIANDVGYTNHTYLKTDPIDLNKLVIGITNAISILSVTRSKDLMSSIFNNIIALGYQLGFNEDMVIKAYYDKNKVNYARQDNGY